MSGSDFAQAPDLFQVLVKPGVQPLPLDVQLSSQVLDFQTRLAGFFQMGQHHTPQAPATGKFPSRATAAGWTTPTPLCRTTTTTPTPGDPIGPTGHRRGTRTDHLGHGTLHLVKFLFETFLFPQQLDDAAEFCRSEFC